MYYQGDPGDVCKDVKHVIRETHECLVAIKAVGIEASGEYWSRTDPRIPQGCSIRDGGDTMIHLEKSTGGLGNGREDLIPICLRKGIYFLVKMGTISNILIILNSFFEIILD